MMCCRPEKSKCTNVEWSQCGGKHFHGKRCCPKGLECVPQNEWYAQCRYHRHMNPKEWAATRAAQEAKEL